MAFVNTLHSLGKIILPKENPVELSITNNTVTIDPNSGSYFFLDGIDTNLTINISSLSASSKTIYLKLNFEQDNIVINWPNNIKWQEISSPSISQYEDLFISLMTLDGGTTWYSEPVIKTKPIVDLSNYMENKYPSTKGSLTSLPITDLNYFNSVRPISCDSMIRYCSSLTLIDLSDFDTSNVTNMSSMFDECNSLTSLNVSNFDTSNVTDTNNMFCRCRSLTSVDLSDWNTSNITDMWNMFRECSSLTSLDLSNWDTNNVANMETTFYGCSSLTSLDLSNWDTSNVTNMRDMFSNCDSLKYLILDSNTCKFKVQPNVDCKIIVPLDYITAYTNDSAWSSRANKTIVPIEAFDITKSNGGVYASIDWDWIETEEYSWPGYKWVKDFYPTTYTTMTQLDTNGRDFLTTVGGNYNCDYMFAGCSNLTTLDLSNVDFSNATSMSNIFDGDSNLTTINVTGTKVNNTSAPIIGQKATTGISNLDISVVTNCSNMFKNNTALTTVDLSTWNTSAITNTSSMFDGCSNLTSLDLSGLDLSGVTSCGNMFKDAPLTAGIDVTNTKVNNTDAATICQKASNTSAKDVDISLVTNMSSLFNGNTRLTSIDLTDWDTSNVTNTSSMFNNCSNLTSIDLSGLDLSAVTSCGSMFYNAPLTTGIDVTNTKVNNTDASMICQKATNASAKDVDISLVTNMSSLFNGNTRLTTIDISDWDTSNVTNTSSMFNNCSNLTTIDISGCDFRSVTSASNMFNGCSSLNSIDVTGTKINNSMVTVIGQTAKTLGTIEDLNVAAVTSMDSMFQNNTAATTLDLSGWDVDSVTNTDNMFNGCSNLTSVNMSGLDFSSVTSRANMFKNAPVTNGINVTNTKVNNTIASAIGQMASNSTAKDLDVSIVTNMMFLFSGNTRLTSIDLTNWDMSNVTIISGMFNNCSNLTTIDISGCDFRSVTSASNGMLSGCSSLNNLIVTNCKVNNVSITPIANTNKFTSGLDTSSVTDMSYLFSDNTTITTLDLSGWDTSNVTSLYRMFEGCTNLTSINTTGLNFDSVTNISYMFSGCSSLRFVDLTNFNFPNVTECSFLFSKSGIQSAVISSSTFKSDMVYGWMLSGASNLSVLDLSNFDTRNNNNIDDSSMFYETNIQYIILDSLEIKFIPKTSTLFHPSYNYSKNCIVLVPDSMISSYNNISWGGFNFNRSTRLKPLENYTITRSSSGITVTPNAIQLSSFTVNLNSSSSSSTVKYTKTVKGNDITYLITQNQYVVGDYCSNTPAITVDISYTLNTANQTIAFNGNNAPATETYYLIA